jgi:hypothetical protein
MARKTRSRSRKARSPIKSLKDAVQKAIEDGATSVEEVHRRIMAMPFDQLAKIAMVEGVVTKARKWNDKSLGAFYDAIRAINARIGELADMALRRIGQG